MNTENLIDLKRKRKMKFIKLAWLSVFVNIIIVCVVLIFSGRVPNYCFEYEESDTITITGYKCDVFKRVIIPDEIKGKKITSIGDGAFEGIGLIDVKFSDNIIMIGKNAFKNNNLEIIILPHNLLELGEYSFSNNKLNYALGFSNLKVIPEGAFMNNFIEGIALPNSVTRIGKYAFKGNNIYKFTLSSFIEAVEEGAFSDNDNLVRIFNNSGKSFDFELIINNRIGIPMETGIIESGDRQIEIIKE